MTLHQPNKTTVGLISDTHGLIRPEVIQQFTDVDVILHAGDVGSQHILDTLQQIAPTHAVRGNCDHGELGTRLRLREPVEIDDVLIYLHHSHQPLDLEPKAAGIRAVIYGHTHLPRIEQRKGVWFINPGSAGPRRFRQPVSVGKLFIENGKLKPELIELDVP